VLKNIDFNRVFAVFVLVTMIMQTALIVWTRLDRAKLRRKNQELQERLMVQMNQSGSTIDYEVRRIVDQQRNIGNRIFNDLRKTIRGGSLRVGRIKDHHGEYVVFVGVPLDAKTFEKPSDGRLVSSIGFRMFPRPSFWVHDYQNGLMNGGRRHTSCLSVDEETVESMLSTVHSYVQDYLDLDERTRESKYCDRTLSPCLP
jgi:hypothetical protein